MRGEFDSELVVFELKKKIRDLENNIIDLKSSFERR